jgi:hypothetical protein
VSKLDNEEIVARAIRMELDTDNNDLYLVFKVTNEFFSKKVREDWLKDLPMKVIGKNLIIKGS